ncbi:MAG: transglutaminase domain-containing protein, partial [Planctomycetales bacterium]|nr:transglutaminase domain-containing protein [Planctomycetales bacterium]
MNTEISSEEKQTAKTKWIAVGLGAVVVIALLATSVDWSEESGTGNVEDMSTLGSPGLTSFNKAMELLEGLSEYESGQAQVSILRSLQAWLRDSDPVVDWVADPMAARLPARYRPRAREDILKTNSIEAFDVIALREASWLRDVARTVVETNTTAPDIAAISTATTNSVDAKYANDLDAALRIFDWVVRNIQTDAPVEAGSQNRYGCDMILPVWQSLLYGHGTAIEKARTFVLLCRQVNIEVLMLGVEQAEGDPAEWLPAVYLGDDLFLFDMDYGTPVLKSGNIIATLADVIDDPSILSIFDIGDISYRTRRKDLSSVVAMIDATPSALSQRMKMIEDTMAGRKMKLTVTPSPIAKRLRQSKGITRAEIWTLPYEMYARRDKVNADPQAASAIIQALSEEQELFDIRNAFSSEHSGFTRQYAERTRNVDTRVSLIQGRLLHFKGAYENAEGGEFRGATTHYFEIRPSDAELKEVTDLAAKIKQEGVLTDSLPQADPDGTETDTVPTPELTAEQKAKQLEQALASLDRAYRILAITKENATYWMGLVSFDRGNYKVAS